MPQPIVALVGATASGKTGLSLDLAERLGGEVVNTDAMQVYRGMDIGTAKLPVAERRGIPHHLLDMLDVTEPATVAHFQGWARAAIADIREPRRDAGAGGRLGALHPRDRRPLRVPRHRRVAAPRARGRARARSADPPSTTGSRASIPRPPRRSSPTTAAARSAPSRSIALTGRPYGAGLPRLEYVDPLTVQIGVDIDRPTLDERIARRVDEMFAAGLRRGGRGPPRPRPRRRPLTAQRAIGYREVIGFLAGDRTLAEAIEQTKTATRRFARRQDGWFRKDPRIVWVAHDDPDRVEKAVGAVEALS